MVFEVTNDLTLIELLDFDHPLLKEAQRKTNGTFNHSIVVGNLAEACAKAIGAHSLLCRVGAYYHDIGKMAKSEYFIENQFRDNNKHDNNNNNNSNENKNEKNKKKRCTHARQGIDLYRML